MSRTLLNWGIFLVVLGAIPLAVQAGTLDVAAAQQLLRLWPLIVIGIGVGLLLRYTTVAALGGVIVAATAGLLGGALLAGGVGGFAGACAGGNPGGELASQSGTFIAERASIDLELTCVALTVERLPGTDWAVEARHAAGRAPNIEAAPERLAARTDSGDVFVSFGDDVRRDWRLVVPQQVTLSMSLTLNASSAVMDLADGPFDSLSGTLNASDARLDLERATELRTIGMTFNASSGTLSLPAASVTGNMTLNASSLNLCVPPDVPVRIDHSETLSSDNFAESGLTQVGEAWQTAGFATAGQRIDLQVSSNVSSITLSRAGGCP